MKSCSPALDAHSRSGQTTLTRLFKVTRKPDLAVYGFTSHDRDLVVAGVTYRSTTSFNPFNLNQKINEDSTTDLEGAFDDVITRADVLAGLWNKASFQLYLANWNNLTQGVGILATGAFGIFDVEEFGFKVQLRGKAFSLTFLGGNICGPVCRVDFGSAKCAPGGSLDDGTDINSLLQSGTVVTTDGSRSMNVSGLVDAGKQLDGGTVTFDSGGNDELSSEVLHVALGSVSPATASVVTLRPWVQLAPIAPGDTFKIFPGCDRKFSTCSGIYKNGKNFQGENNAPDPDAVIQYPDYVAPHT